MTLMNQLGLSIWPLATADLEENVAQFMVHLVTERGLQPATIWSCLAGVQMAQLVRGGTLAPFHSNRVTALLAAMDRLNVRPTIHKRPITTTLLVEFANFLPTAPPEVHHGWAPMVIGVWLMLRLDKMVPSGASFDLRCHLSKASISANLGGLGLVATVTLQKAKGQGHSAIGSLYLPQSSYHSMPSTSSAWPHQSGEAIGPPMGSTVR